MKWEALLASVEWSWWAAWCSVHYTREVVVGPCPSCRAQGEGSVEPEAVGGPCAEGTVSTSTRSAVVGLNRCGCPRLSACAVWEGVSGSVQVCV